jgi:hypothetical protein
MGLARGALGVEFSGQLSLVGARSGGRRTASRPRSSREFEHHRDMVGGLVGAPLLAVWPGGDQPFR